MATKTILFVLCAAAMASVAIALALVLYSKYLINRCVALEKQNEYKTELIGALNSHIDELQKDNDKLQKDYYELDVEYTKLRYERIKQK